MALFKMNVLIVDDHALFRMGLEMVLIQLLPGVRVQQSTQVDEALSMMAATSFDLVLLDWHMPGRSGAAAVQALREQQLGGRIVTLSGDLRPEVVRASLDAGACGFISKDASTAELIEALNTVAQGQICLPGPVHVWLDAQARPPGAQAWPLRAPSAQGQTLDQAFPELTPRQCEVLQLAARGLTNKVIARSLNISSDTVKQHLSLIYQSLDVHTRTEAVYLLAQRGIRVLDVAEPA